ncbi:MAG: GGDEF domain-containing protein [Chloroflexota bacterium]|nr:GGDEF domain-containing protein [Chloroflexota bacterium]MDE3194228.1 GGDEF domain-containing protein [Chloroflexota bacterium]
MSSSAIQQAGDVAGLVLAISSLAITIAGQLGTPRPAYARSWVFFGLATVGLLAHAMLDMGGVPLMEASRVVELGTIALLTVAFAFMYGADRVGIGKIQDAADRDSLTGLFNRRAFGVLADECLVRTVEHGGHCAVAILDLDGFKALNDAEGHQAGDRGLQLVASAIRANVRPSDVAARYGGDEFIVLFDRCEATEAEMICARLLRSVVLLSVASGRQLTFSCGVSIAPADGRDLRDLIATADRQLIEVKRTGKNAVRTVGEGHPPPADAGARHP